MSSPHSHRRRHVCISTISHSIYYCFSAVLITGECNDGVCCIARAERGVRLREGRGTCDREKRDVGGARRVERESCLALPPSLQEGREAMYLCIYCEHLQSAEVPRVVSSRVRGKANQRRTSRMRCHCRVALYRKARTASLWPEFKKNAKIKL